VIPVPIQALWQLIPYLHRKERSPYAPFCLHTALLPVPLEEAAAIWDHQAEQAIPSLQTAFYFR